MNITKVSICNMALAKLGNSVESIATLEENSTVARQCRMVYDRALDVVLSSGFWNFATVIEPLAVLSGVTIPGWDYVYSKPALCMRVVSISNDSTLPGNPEKFRIIGNMIVANIELANIEYIKRIDDPSAYDGMFVDAFAYKLAAELAGPITGDDNKAKTMLQLYAMTLSEANRVNDSQTYNPTEDVSSFMDAR